MLFQPRAYILLDLNRVFPETERSLTYSCAAWGPLISGLPFILVTILCVLFPCEGSPISIPNLIALLIIVLYFAFSIAVTSHNTATKFGTNLSFKALKLKDQPFREEYETHIKRTNWIAGLTYPPAFLYWSWIVSASVRKFTEAQNPIILCFLVVLWIFGFLSCLLMGSLLLFLPLRLCSTIQAREQAYIPLLEVIPIHFIQLVLILPWYIQVLLAILGCIPAYRFRGDEEDVPQYLANAPPKYFARGPQIHQAYWGFVWIGNLVIWAHTAYSLVELFIFWSMPLTYHMRWIHLLPLHFWAGIMVHRWSKLVPGLLQINTETSPLF